FLAFSMLVVTANIFIGRILRESLSDRTEEIMYTADANVRAGLSAAETILLNSYHIVKGMMDRGASDTEILDYLLATTEWMQQQAQGLLGFYGIYAYIHGEFYDSIDMNPGSDFIPQMRPWYQLGIRSSDSVVYTTPYTDWRTGEPIFSAVKSIYIDDQMAGMLSVDISVEWLLDYISTLSPAAGGYGMLLTENMAIMVHPEEDMLGRMLQALGTSYNEIARILRNGDRVTALRIEDIDGSSAIAFFNPISNGWFIGLVIPRLQFYWNLYVSSFILIILGLALSLTLSWILLRLSTEKMQADEESKSKSSFLASMSHEIRTPMNAITGMAELALREDMSETVRDHVLTIKQAGANLLSIINDILDFSKVEAGLLEIVPINYTLSSLVNDVVNIIRNRITEKPVRFFTNIDSKIPNNLIGDEVRLRQILLNLLSNAVKYTEKGHISLFITIHSMDTEGKGRVWLNISVSDTGFGIKPEDKENLFKEFIQLDSAKNRGIEGTGLGLSITKRIAAAMGGSIKMESEYGKGSTFTVVIPQGIKSNEPFAFVENALDKNVLIYEGRLTYTNSLRWTLENMGVPYTLVTNADDFAQALREKEWFFIVSGYGLYDRLKLILTEIDFPGGKPPPLLALMVGQENEAYIPNVFFVYMPVHSLTIANIFNGKADKKIVNDINKSQLTFSFTIPGTRILVVDDVSTNLKVAEGLLSPYGAVVDTCLSGEAAIKLIYDNALQGKNYDIIFMDHMMPQMDGIETTEAIRASGDQVPIIALTANAVVGMRELFLEKGFNDFLAKPIDVVKLDEILQRWIPEEKIEKGLDRIEETSEQKSEARAALLRVFRQDAEKAITVLLEALASGNIKLYTTTVHAMKSALANIGETKTSEEASALESAGLGGDAGFLAANTEKFIHSLGSLIEKFDFPDTELNEIILEDTKSLIEQLITFKAACENYNDTAALSALDFLKEYRLKKETKEALVKMRDMLFLHSDFDGAAEQAELLIDKVEEKS
ncbi:MAG: ATP-binding protein, partial [Treponema sp.]|nr:ATP-binding protein [Treponema sp.]